MLHVYAAFALALAAPMYGRLEYQPRVLAVQETITVVIFILLWSVVIPGSVLLILARLRRWNMRVGTVAMKAVLGATCALIPLAIYRSYTHQFLNTELGRQFGGLGWLMIVATVLFGYLIYSRYQKWQWLRSLLTIAAFGSLLFPVSLLWVFSKVSARPEIKQTLTAQLPVPIVMVVFDCFCGASLLDQNRQIDVHRYPRFAELAATSNWYRNCTSVHPRTDQAVPAILAGQWPEGTPRPTLEQYPQNLFTLLNATGAYELTSFEPFTLLCPPDPHRDRVQPDPWTQWIGLTQTAAIVFLHDLVPNDVAIELPRIPRTWMGLEHALAPDRQQRQGLIRYGWDAHRDVQFHHFLDCISKSDRPNLWFGHFALPHFPWSYLPSGHAYAEDAGIRETWGVQGLKLEDWVDDEVAVLHAHQQHMLQLGYTDKLVGELIDHLRSVDLFDRCLLIVVADHGVSFRAGMSGRLPTEKNLADIMSVPLFVKLPGQKSGDVIDLSVETADVLPTVLDILKLTPPTPLKGQSVVAIDFKERPNKVFTDEQQALVIDASFESRHDVLVEHLARFGTGEDPLRIFKIGPHSELLGRPLSEVQVTGKSVIQIQPINFTATVDYNSGPLVPAHLQAAIKLQSQPATRIEFAIAVNDTVWGTTVPYRHPYFKDYWRVMLPESAIRTGTNQIRVFQIVTTDGGLSLAECPIGEPAFGPELPMPF